MNDMPVDEFLEKLYKLTNPDKIIDHNMSYLFLMDPTIKVEDIISKYSEIIQKFDFNKISHPQHFYSMLMHFFKYDEFLPGYTEFVDNGRKFMEKNPTEYSAERIEKLLGKFKLGDGRKYWEDDCKMFGGNPRPTNIFGDPNPYYKHE